jgi:hypothetical protein
MPLKYLIFDSEACFCGRKFKFQKSPNEDLKFTVDFRSALPEGVYVDSVAVIVTDKRTGVDETLNIYVPPAEFYLDLDLNQVGVTIPLTGGTLGHGYDVQLLIGLDDGFTVIERTVEFNVK